MPPTDDGCLVDGEWHPSLEAAFEAHGRNWYAKRIHFRRGADLLVLREGDHMKDCMFVEVPPEEWEAMKTKGR